MAGFTGQVTFRGDLARFWPWLALGQWLHVGKHATFGLGQYRIEKEKRSA
jgi:CRISPR/Cas system endoribonuclease Cas6 (RAMP superfamily)